MKATLLHYPDTPMRKLQITGSALTAWHHFWDPVIHDSPTVTLGHTKGYPWCQTAASNRIGLTSELWLSVHFNKYTMAVFLFKEPAFGPLLALNHPPPACKPFIN